MSDAARRFDYTPFAAPHALNIFINPKAQGGPMATTRCKFRCNSVFPSGPGEGAAKVVNLSAVYAPDDPESENGKFWTATPSGQMTLWINNPDGAAIFEQGKDYYLDLTPAEVAQA